MRSRAVFGLAALLASTAFMGCGPHDPLAPLGQQVALTELGNNFGALRPALASRTTACILCHAQVDGDFITDLGYGSPFFMGTDSVANHPNQTPAYSPFETKYFSWQAAEWSSASIMGNIYVPDAVVEDPRLINAYNAGGNGPAVTSLPLATFLQGSYVDPAACAIGGAGCMPFATQAIAQTNDPNIANPGLRGQVISRQQIWIGSPTEDDIRSLEQSPGVKNVLSQIGASIYQGTPLTDITGLEAVQGPTSIQYYITNGSTPVTCRGDVIVDGVLFLNNLVVDTDGNGCRLYVTNSVFIQGPITYLNGDADGENIQITSGRAIVMGTQDLSTRLTQSYLTVTVNGLRRYPTDALEMEFNQEILSDSLGIEGLTDDAGPFWIMTDASGNLLATHDTYNYNDGTPWVANGANSIPNPATCAAGVTGPTAGSPCSIMLSGYLPSAGVRKSIDYKHVLLNAAKVYSRYYGTITGVVIGEDVLFAVGQFKFSADPVLSGVPLLPLVQDEVFSMSAQ